MFQTFNENQYYLQSELLRHGELDWLARNTYFGDQRNYVETDIDDTFTPDDAWDATTTPGSLDYSETDDLRMNAGDVATASTWEANNNFRMDQLFNMGGTAAYQSDNSGPDPLLAAFQASCTSTRTPRTVVAQATRAPASHTRIRSAGSATPTTRPTWTSAARLRTTSRRS